jgi:hypothetical protein
MRLLTYAGLDASRWRAPFDKFRAAIERDDLRSVDMKKLAQAPYYRGKLDAASRVLVTFVRYRGETVCLALEIIAHHAYEKSRFLRGARVDEDKIEDATVETLAAEAPAARYLHPGRRDFHLLDKPLSFDAAQEAIHHLPLPLVLVGSAGSGKTALALHKVRAAEGAVLYLTQSAWLARSAREIYFAHGYENAAQEPEFLSYREFLETLQVPQGREVAFADFGAWFERHRQAYRFTDAHQCFEEFRGVIGSQPEGVLSREAYRALGARQSIFAPEQRDAIHELFDKYRAWLADSGLFDINLLAHAWMAQATPRYDLIAIDEVQDLTCAQLALALRTLKCAGQFLLCGDSNQIVHPNFFSWSAVKQLFWRDPALAERQQLSVLSTNYRNAQSVTRVANHLLKIKQARFGSIDRESNYLVDAAASAAGEVRLLADSDTVQRELDATARASTQVAVIVLRDEDKAAARRVFRTPLLFCVHEAKGLEYPTVVLWNLIGGQRRVYAEICAGVTPEDLAVDTLQYRRAKDRDDRSLEVYKFYVNALYVALTRAIERIVWVESDTGHALLELLGVRESAASAKLDAVRATREDWEREAHKLEQQGKLEQAQAIRSEVLRAAQVPWTVMNEASLADIAAKALDHAQISRKPREALLDFALWHGHDRYLERLAKLGWGEASTLLKLRPEDGYDRAQANARERHLAPFARKNFKDVLVQCDRYGVDHRTAVDCTPLAMAALAGNGGLVDALLDRGADSQQRDLFGWTAAMHALERATRDSAYAERGFAAVFPKLAPGAIDVEVDGRLVRLLPRHGEYLVFLLMLVGLKTLASKLRDDAKPLYLRLGFSAEALARQVVTFPGVVMAAERRRQSYFNQVLARAERDAGYQPARKLWLRVRTGYYLPNPALRIRVELPGGESRWEPLYVASRLDLVLAGTGYGAVGTYLERFLPVAATKATSEVAVP